MTIDLLPPVARDLAETIGLDATLALVERWGGTPLWVRPEPWPELVTVIGQEAAGKLCYAYALCRLDIPRCVRSVRACRDRAILAASAAGATGSDLARAYGLTRRQITKIRRAGRDSEPTPQTDLFGE